jgi:hypothetical protein
MKQASVRLATALAHNVLPVPGGPKSKTPFGGSIPRFTNLSGYRKKHKKKRFMKTHQIFQKLKTYMEQRSLHNFSQFLDLFFAATHVTVGDIRLLLNLHHGDCGVNLGWERNVNLVFVTINTVEDKMRDHDPKAKRLK